MVNVQSAPKQGFFKRLAKNYRQMKLVYWLAVPVLLYYFVFKYAPMFGVTIAFQDYRAARGIMNSKWVGFKHFLSFFNSIYAWRLIRNTVVISVYSILFGFPAPILLALLINEIKHSQFKSVVQTISYMPHFISTVVICGVLVDFLASDGVITDLLVTLGGTRTNLLAEAGAFRTIYVGSSVWQSVGWGSIIYLATLSGTDPNLYEAAVIDGAGRFRQAVHITLPTLVPLIVLQLIMRMGNIMSVGYEKIILLYSGLTYDTADVISSYVYRRGLQQGEYSFGAAVGLFNSVINLCLLVLSNWIAKTTTGESMW
ncbi:MAG TPA: ABC transporter permease subunit [Clostridia bacterium]|nr:ABC transporter permease subunit [Clostridia bacterium]